MSYSPLSTGEVAVNAPVSNPLMTKVKDNFDYLKNLEKRLPKAFGSVTGTTIHDSYNVASVSNPGGGQFSVVFSTPLSSANYCVMANGAKDNTNSSLIIGALYGASRTTTGFSVNSELVDGTDSSPAELSFVVFQNS